MLYTREKEEAKKEEGATAAAENSVKHLKDKTSGGNGSAEAGDPLQGLDDTAKLCFQTINEHLTVPLSVLRAIYDMQGQSTNALLMAVHEE